MGIRQCITLWTKVWIRNIPKAVPLTPRITGGDPNGHPDLFAKSGEPWGETLTFFNASVDQRSVLAKGQGRHLGRKEEEGQVAPIPAQAGPTAGANLRAPALTCSGFSNPEFFAETRKGVFFCALGTSKVRLYVRSNLAGLRHPVYCLHENNAATMAMVSCCRASPL